MGAMQREHEKNVWITPITLLLRCYCLRFWVLPSFFPCGPQITVYTHSSRYLLPCVCLIQQHKVVYTMFKGKKTWVVECRRNNIFFIFFLFYFLVLFWAKTLRVRRCMGVWCPSPSALCAFAWSYCVFTAEEVRAPLFFFVLCIYTNLTR